ncbi:MAG: porin family protein [Adhaeribacter sp.]
MKKFALLLLAGLSFSFAQAQTKVGLKGGLTLSNIAGDLENEDVYMNKFGFNGGLTANFSLVGDNFLSIQPELLYSQKGYKYRDEEFTDLLGREVRRKGTRNFNYLDLPVLLKVNAGGLFFEAGPQLSYLLAIRDNTETSVNGDTDSSWRSINKDDLAELEVGYAAGLGFQAANGLSLGVRYNGSMSDLAKSDPNNDELVNARHSAFQLQLGFLLGGGKTE